MLAEGFHLGPTLWLAGSCTVVETVEQMLYRLVGRRPNLWWPLFVPGAIVHGLYLLTWYLLLRAAPLAIALPMMGLQYITIAFAAKLLFREQVDTRRWVGIVLIAVGFVLVAVNAKEG